MNLIEETTTLRDEIDKLIDNSINVRDEIFEYEAFKILDSCYESLYDLLSCMDKDLSNEPLGLSHYQAMYSKDLLRKALNITLYKEVSMIYTLDIEDFSQLSISLNYLCDFLVEDRNDILEFNFDKFISEVLFVASSFCTEEDILTELKDFNSQER